MFYVKEEGHVLTISHSFVEEKSTATTGGNVIFTKDKSNYYPIQFPNIFIGNCLIDSKRSSIRFLYIHKFGKIFIEIFLRVHLRPYDMAFNSCV